MPVRARGQRAGGISSGEVSAEAPHAACLGGCRPNCFASLPHHASVHPSPQSVLSAEAPPVSGSSGTQQEKSCSADWVMLRPVTVQVSVSGISLQESSAFLADRGGLSRAQ